jgi:geranylgeranyl pyrophosphate synthase
MNSLKTEILQKNHTLKEIFEPVSFELNSFDEKLMQSVSSDNEFLDNITGYIVNAGGKRLRPAVSFLFAKALNGGTVSLQHYALGQAVELIHTATLIHDDIIDNADTRRNKKTINSLWNEKTAVIAGDYLLAKALSKLAFIKSPIIVDVFANIMSDICTGEIQQISRKNNSVSIDEYIEKSKRKTAMLFIAAAESAAILTPGTNNETISAARNFALNYGIAFQITDDIINYSTGEEAGKPALIDIKNGILTAPVLFALEEYEQKYDFELKEIIKKTDSENFDENRMIEIIKNSSGIAKTKELAKIYTEKAVKSLSVFEENKYTASLKNLAKYNLVRTA